MWPVAPARLCNKHLLGEHLELHMIVSSIRHGMNLAGFYNNGLIDTNLIRSRHENLAEEMTQRGMKHQSPLPEFIDPHQGWIDPQAETLLMGRCGKCRERV
jgi:hypothetical protein